MNCEQAQELAALAASGDVTASDRLALECHAAGCAVCRAEVAAFGALVGQLAHLREESAVPPVYAAVRARVVAELSARSRPDWLRSVAWPAFVAVLACSLMVVVALRHDVPVPVIQADHPAEISGIADTAPEPVLPARSRQRSTRPPVRVAVSSEPLVVQMFTDDPDVVIYWIADAKDTRSKKEIMQ